MRNPSQNSHSAKIFGSLTETEVKGQIKTALRRETAVLKAAPDELKPVLKERFDYLRGYKDRKPPKPVKIGNWKATPADQFQTFTSTAESDKWMKEINFSDWEKSLTGAERHAIESHKSSSYAVNQELRSPDPNHVLSPSTEGAEQNSWTPHSPSIRSPRPVTLIRHFDLSDVGLTYGDVKLGHDIVDKGFIPTSVNPSHSWSGHRFEIRVPAGRRSGIVESWEPGSRANMRSPWTRGG